MRINRLSIAAIDSQRVINSKLYRQTLPGPGGVTQGAGSPGLIGPAGFRLD